MNGPCQMRIKLCPWLCCVVVVVASLLAMVSSAEPTVQWSDTSFNPLDPPITDFVLKDAVNIDLQFTEAAPQYFVDDPEVLQRSCASDSAATNLYGFTYWNSRSKFFSLDISIADRDPSLVYLGKVATPGLALAYGSNNEETVTCGPFLQADGTPYDKQAEPFKFTIISYTSAILLSSKGTIASDVDEAMVRGKTLDHKSINVTGYVQLDPDAWLSDKLDVIYGLFQCRSNGDVGPCEDIAPGLLLRSGVSIDPDAPNRLHISLGPNPSFNIDHDVSIEFSKTPLLDSPNPITVKAREIAQQKIIIKAYQGLAPLLSPNVFVLDDQFNPTTEQFVISEQCVRTGVGCRTGELYLGFRIVKDDGTVDRDARPGWQFQGRGGVINRLKTNGITGPRWSEANERERLKFWEDELLSTPYDLGGETEPRARELGLLFQTTDHQGTIPSYETWEQETVTIDLSFQVVEQLEPPIMNPTLVFVVTPSPGTLTCNLRDITEEDIWFAADIQLANFTLELAGESWEPSQPINLIVSQGLSNDNAVEGWDARRDCIFPSSNVQLTSVTTATLQFANCPDFDIRVEEEITFSFSQSFMRSGLDLANVPLCSFKITPSDGRVSLRGDTTVEETAFRLPGLSWEVLMLGETWPEDDTQFQNCAAELIANLHSNSTIDTEGWEEHKMTMMSLSRVAPRRALLSVTPTLAYNTRRGEQIFGTVGATCTASGRPPVGNITFYIAPQRGTMGLSLARRGVALDGSDLSESFVRSGGVEIKIGIVNDTFLSSSTENPDLASLVFDAISSNGNEASGWNRKKSQLTSPSKVTITPELITIHLGLLPEFDVTVNETVSLAMLNTWVDSQREPTNNVSMTIFVSPGTFLLNSWLGSDRNVTENDVREGRVFFELSLLGDQFRRQKASFEKSFSTDAVAPFGFASLKRSLVPDIDFVSFAYGGGFENITFSLQASEVFDIAADEEISITWSGGSVASGIPPLWDFGTSLQDTFRFNITAVPGDLILSGDLYYINEKMMRRGNGLAIFLTLFGEKWDTSANETLFVGLLSDRGVDEEPKGFVSLKPQLASPSRITFDETRSTAAIRLLPNSSYNIDSVETIEINVMKEGTQSKLRPLRYRGAITVTPTGGEVTLIKDPPEFSETELRSSVVTLMLRITGDEWNVTALDLFPTEFVQGFTSQSSILQEPDGFLKVRRQLLQLPTELEVDRRPDIRFPEIGDPSLIHITLRGSPSYDIANDEVITFSVLNPMFVRTGVLPDPATIRFVIRSVPRVLVAIVEDSASQAPKLNGEFDRSVFMRRMASMLSVDEDRVDIVENQNVSRREDGRLVQEFFMDGPGSTAQLAAAELGDFLLSLNTSYLYDQMGIKWVYYQDAKPPDSEIYDPPPVVAVPPPKTESVVGYVVWIVVGFTVIAIVVGGYFFVMSRRGARLGGRVRGGTNRALTAAKEGETGVAFDPVHATIFPKEISLHEKHFAGPSREDHPVSHRIEREDSKIQSGNVKSLKQIARERVAAQQGKPLPSVSDSNGAPAPASATESSRARVDASGLMAADSGAFVALESASSPPPPYRREAGVNVGSRHVGRPIAPQLQLSKQKKMVFEHMMDL